MRKLNLSVAVGHYDRVRPLIDGDVQIEGVDPVYVQLSPEEAFFRAFRDEAFDITELSMSSYFVKTAQGTCPYVGIPVFLSRAFRHTSIYVRKDRVKSPEDLRGRRVGIPEYQLTALVWARALLWDRYGVNPNEITWVLGGIDEPGRPEKIALNLPSDIRLEVGPVDKTISQLLDEGAVDGFIAPRPPSRAVLGNLQIDWLFDDPVSAAKEYFRDTGIFPIMHIVGIRKEIVEANPWLPASVFKAFEQSRQKAQDLLEDTSATKVLLPFVEEQVRAAKATLGDNYWSYGVPANIQTLEAFAEHHFRQGLSVRKVSVDELFHPSTYEQFKI